MSSPLEAPSLSSLVYTKERIYYALILTISVAVYGALGYAAMRQLTLLAPIAFYVVIFALAFFLAHGMALGRIRGNGVRVSERQLPLVHRQVQEHARTLQLSKVPDVYVIQSGGIMNAFATRFLGRSFVVIHSDVLDLAMQQGEAAVGFIVAHELAHHKRGHLNLRWLTLPGRVFPYLGFAYSRACEYTCDAFGARCQPDGAVSGLLALAAGKLVYKAVDAAEFARQASSENDFWVRRAEMFSTHPRLPKRVAQVLNIGAKVPSYTPMQSGDISRRIAMT
jgi:Zn-dependent protease with chaperone function